MSLGLSHPLLTATVAIVLGCLFWRYQWRLINRRKPQSSDVAEENLIPDPNLADTNIGSDSERSATNNITNLNYPSALEEHVEHDRRILCTYTWTSYTSLLPAIQETLEPAVLKNILGTYCDVSHDACIACLKDNPNVRTLLLQGWEKGTFEALRSDEVFLSLSKPSGHSNSKQVSEGNEDEEDNELKENESLCNHDTPTNGMAEQLSDVNLGIYQSKFIAGHDINVAVSVWQASHTSDEDRKIATWFFGAVDYRAVHNEIAKKRLEGTGRWLLQSKTYEEWCQSSQQRLMWCPGIPGVGKTVMASLIVDHLRTFDEAHVFVGFIYFNYKLRSRQSKLAIFEALCRQAFETHPKLEMKQSFMDLYNWHEKRKSRPTDTELRSTLSKVFPHYSGCYIVLDALDEYTAEYSDKKVREVIGNILSLGSNVKLLITSRILGNMETTFRELGASREDIEGDDGDMRAYLGERVAILKSNLDFEVSDEFSERIIAKVIEAAKGRFLVAELGMNLLAEQFNLGELEDVLDKLPNEIDDTYVCVIELIKTYPEGRRELAMNALKWVAYANRRLSVCELQHALATKRGRKETDKYVTPLSTITSLCAGLIVVQDGEDSFEPSDNRIVRFVHFTTQEFFEKTQSKYFCNSHQEMFSTCVEYLSVTSDFGLPADFTWDADPFNYLMERHQFPFYDYSAMNWGHHASTHHTSLHKEVEKFLLRNDRVLDLTWDYTLKASSVGHDGMERNEGSGIFLAAYHNQFNTLPQLCSRMHTFPRTRNRRTPLHIAALDEWAPLSNTTLGGRGPTVKVLLEHGGIEVDMEDNQGRTPFLYAARYGNIPIVKLLLEHGGVNVDTRDKYGRTPLSYTAWNGNEVIVKLLLEHGGVAVDTEDKYGRTPLLYATQYGSEPIVQLLLEHGGVEVDAKDQFGWTPLSYAARNGREQIVKLLLEHGAVEVDLADNDGRTPLSYAAQIGNEVIVKLLLEHGGVDVDTKDNDGRTPLSYAALSGSQLIVQLLLENGGVDVNTKDKYGRTPLSYTTQYGNEPIVKLLLEHQGVEADTKDNIGRTPLSFAAEYGKELIVKHLLEHGGIEVNTKDNDGRTPLSYAAENDSQPTVKLLHEHGGVLSAVDMRYLEEPIVKLLLEHGHLDNEAYL